MEFLAILKKTLSDPKYGTYTPSKEDLKWREQQSKKQPVKAKIRAYKGYYGNEDCLREEDMTERKNR